MFFPKVTSVLLILSFLVQTSMSMAIRTSSEKVISSAPSLLSSDLKLIPSAPGNKETVPIVSPLAPPTLTLGTEFTRVKRKGARGGGFGGATKGGPRDRLDYRKNGSNPNFNYSNLLIVVLIVLSNYFPRN